MVNKVKLNLNIPNNIWLVLLVVILIIVLINRCNREGFALDSSKE